MKIKKYAAAVILGGAMLSGAAFAAGTNVSQTVTATLNFDTPLSITKVTDINFGLLAANTAGTYTIDTTGNVTATNGGSILSGLGKSAGSYTVAGSTGQTINLSYTAGTPVSGVTLLNPTCSYAGAAVTGCAGNGLIAPGTGKPLLVGVSAQTDNSVTGVIAPTFTLNVFYN
jgi:hypothetical protein